MNQILIIGARGMGRTIFDYVCELPDYNHNYVIKGYLDDKSNALDGFSGYPPIISSVEDYSIQQGDLFICSLGDIHYKKYYSQIIINKGGHFFTLIHPQAKVARNVKIGEGAIIAPFSVIGNDVIIGRFCLIQTFSLIGHDVCIGEWSRIDAHAVCTGGVVVGNSVTIHTGAIINQKVRVEDESCVGAGSFVIRRVKKGTTVYGNPAIELTL